MKSFLTLLACLPLLAAAADDHTPAQTRKDVERHRAMAAAHEAAARCLEDGKKDGAQCEKELQAACRDLAIGKSCGMKHAH